MVSDIPSVTVLIPTRNRRDEVAATVECVLRSTYPNLVVQVFDNCSQDGTAELLEQRFGSDIRLARSDQPLAMVDSFEKAYALVSTDWVFGLGADDGLHRDAISVLIEAAVSNGVESAVPQRANYFWPGARERYPHGRLSIPGPAPTRVRSSSDALRQVLRGRERWASLPTAYGGLAHISILHRHESRRGRLINSWTPDLYLSLAVAGEIDRFVAVGFPLMITGTSRNSTGDSQFRGQNKAPVEEFTKLNMKSRIALHPTVASVDGSLPASVQILTLEAYLQTEPSVGFYERILCAPTYQAFAHSFFADRDTPHEVQVWLAKFAQAGRGPLGIEVMAQGVIVIQRLRRRLDEMKAKRIWQAVEIRWNRFRSRFQASGKSHEASTERPATRTWSAARIQPAVNLGVAEEKLYSNLVQTQVFTDTAGT